MKPGDKVVYNGKGTNHELIYPEPFNEPCTIGEIVSDGGQTGAVLIEYPTTKFGDPQAFIFEHLIPLDHWKQAEYMVEELKEELEVTV